MSSPAFWLNNQAVFLAVMMLEHEFAMGHSTAYDALFHRHPPPYIFLLFPFSLFFKMMDLHPNF